MKRREREREGERKRETKWEREREEREGARESQRELLATLLRVNVFMFHDDCYSAVSYSSLLLTKITIFDAHCK